MNNGQSGGNAKKVEIFSSPSSETSENQAFFTAGVGNESPENNNIEPEINLDEENWREALEASVPVGMPTPKELNTPKDVANTEDAGLYSAETSDTSELGQIASVEQQKMPKIATEQDAQRYNPANIRTTGDKLEKSTIPEIDSVINELNQTGNLCNFYDEVRGTDEKPGMVETNLKNSYNRELGKGKAA